MRRQLLRIWLLALPLIAACDFFSVDTELDDACVAFDNQVVPGNTSGKLERTFVYDKLAVLDGFISLDADVTHLDVTLRAVKGAADLSFLDSVSVSLESGGLPALEVIRCDDGACASDTTTSSVSEAAPAGLIAYALSGKIQVKVVLTGPLPESDWSADVKVCLSGQAHLAVGF